MAAIECLYGEPSFLRLTPGTLTTDTKEVAAWGTNMDFLIAIKVTPTFVGATSSSTKAAWFTTEANNGNKYSIPDNSENRNVLDNSIISSDTSTASTEKFECSVIVTPALRKSLIEMFKNATPVVAVREIGRNSSSKAIVGYEYLFGAIGDLKDSPAKGPSTMDFSIVGKTLGAGMDYTLKSGVDMAGYNTAATGALKTITPQNDTARTITALEAADWTAICAAGIVIKDAAA